MSIWAEQTVTLRQITFNVCKVPLSCSGITFALMILLIGNLAFAGPLTVDQPETARLLQLAIPTTIAATETLKEAIKEFEAGRLNDCLVSLEEAVKVSPSLPPPPLMLARLFLKVGNDREALRRFDLLAVSSADEPEIFVSLGELALRQGRLTDAWLQFERAAGLASPPTWDESRTRAFRIELAGLQGEAAERRQDWKTAEHVYAVWRTLEPQSAPALLGLGRSRLCQGDAAAALALFRDAKQRDPETPSAESLLALIYARRGDVANANNWFLKAVSATEITPAIRLEYAQWLLDQDRPDESLQQLAATPDNPLTDDLRAYLGGVAARCLGDLDAAEAAFSKLQQSHPGDWKVADQLALVLIERPDEARRARALQLCEFNLRQRGERATVCATTAWVKLRLGDLASAEQLLQQSLSAAPATATTRYYVSRLFAARGQVVEAERWLREALEQPGLWAGRRTANELANRTNSSIPIGNSPPAAGN